MSTTPLLIDDYQGAMAALKHPALEQSLYDAGGAVMQDALITLHGSAHSERRVVEFSVFTRRFFRHYEHEHFPATLAPLLAPYLQAGSADLVELGYRATMNLTADFAGIDRPTQSVKETETLLRLVKTFSEGATLVHSTRDPALVNAEVAAAMTCFDEDFLQPSIHRRQRLLDNDSPLPQDVLSVLLKNSARLPLAADVLRREIAFFLQAGAHSTANAMVHALHEIFGWCQATAREPASLLADPLLLQRCVHESLRLHPASPVAERRANAQANLNQQEIAAGTAVRINLQQANRDPSVFGADAEQFNPQRALPRGTWPFGLTFGYGTHACMGRDLDGGAVAKADTRPEEHQYGIVTLLVRTLLEHQANPDPAAPPEQDHHTARANWGRYPVLSQPPQERNTA
ncbi:MAG: cytochrome P450 [Pseudomonadales bacterium]